MFNKQISASILAFVALMGVSSAAPTPTPAGGPADACTTVYPSFMGQIQQDKPDLVADNTMQTEPWFALTQVLSEDHSLSTGQFQTVVRFDLPAGAESCNLHSQFPVGSQVGLMDSQPNWSLFNFRVQLSDDDLTWNKVHNTQISATGVLNTLRPHVANIFEPFVWTNIGCSDASYVFALEGDQDQPGVTDFEVYTNQPENVSGPVGPYMTYGCAI